MVLPVEFEKLWREELKNQQGTYSPRMKDDQVERDFWRQFMSKRDHYVQDKWAAKVSKEVHQLLEPYQPETILEVGPGWGNFTLDLAGWCRELTCLDISPEVLGFLKKSLEQEKKKRVLSICSKWEDFVPEQRYDVVFGYNCFYRMLELKSCIRKFNATAEKLCIMGMGTGEKKLYIYFIILLFQMGIAANVRAVPLDEQRGSSSSLERSLGMLVYWEPRHDTK